MHRKTARTRKCSDPGRLKETARSQERLELGATNVNKTMSKWLLFAKKICNRPKLIGSSTCSFSFSFN